jgi:uncharacterized membrane-anchored protein YitT (DUF2179 family)
LIAKRAQTSEKSRTNAETNSTTSSFIWAKVVSKNITKVANQRIKAQAIKLNETIIKNINNKMHNSIT